MNQQLELATKICGILDDKKAADIHLLEVGHLTSIADYFVICSGRSNIQVRSLSDELQERLEEDGVRPLRIEGQRDARWIVLDYASVLVHIFHHEEREFFNIERLWTDGSNRVNL